jgi:hypothetical protein
MSDAITMLRDDLKLLQNECAKQSSDIRSKDDQRMGLVV